MSVILQDFQKCSRFYKILQESVTLFCIFLDSTNSFQILKDAMRLCNIIRKKFVRFYKIMQYSTRFCKILQYYARYFLIVQVVDISCDTISLITGNASKVEMVLQQHDYSKKKEYNFLAL